MAPKTSPARSLSRRCDIDFTEESRHEGREQPPIPKEIVQVTLSKDVMDMANGKFDHCNYCLCTDVN